MSTKTRIASFVTAAALVAATLPLPAFAQAGALDTSFSGDGKQTTNFSPGYDAAYDVAVQADGKLVVAGEAAGQGFRFAVARYNADGTLDATFSGDGKVLTNFTGGADFAVDVAIQADGKIVAVGGARIAGGSFAIARYNPDGTLDSSFSGDGRATVNLTPGYDVAIGALVQTDGKLVLAGAAGGQGTRLGLIRLNLDGTLDASFSGDGKVLTNLTPGIDYVDAVALQADGKIVAAGTANWNRPRSSIALARYNADGTLDTSFAGDGIRTTNLGSWYDGAYGVAVQAADGHLVVVGQAGHRLVVGRYTPTGAPDPGFGGDGIVITDFGPGLDYAEDVALQPDGKIVAGGSARYFGNSRFALVRYQTSGALDTSFSGDGKLVTEFTTGTDRGYGLALQPADGKLVLAGHAAGQGSRFAVARYHAS